MCTYQEYNLQNELRATHFRPATPGSQLDIIGWRQGRAPEPTQWAEIRNSAVTDSRHQITELDGCCKVR